MHKNTIYKGMTVVLLFLVLISFSGGLITIKTTHSQTVTSITVGNMPTDIAVNPLQKKPIKPVSLYVVYDYLFVD